MRFFILLASLASTIPSVFAQAVPEGIAPEAPPPPGCKQTVNGNFTIGIAVFVSNKARRETVAEASVNALQCTLKDGILRDPYGRTASIVANYQFQFDGPPQAGAIYTGGFSVCQNSSLALGGSTVWWRCMSGEFGNLYDRSIGAQCNQVRIVAQFPSSPSSSSAAVVAPSSISPIVSATAPPSFGPTISLAPASQSQTLNTAAPSGAKSASGFPNVSVTRASSTPTQSSASTGGAASTRVPRGETFGFAVGILGAAMML